MQVLAAHHHRMFLCVCHDSIAVSVQPPVLLRGRSHGWQPPLASHCPPVSASLPDLLEISPSTGGRGGRGGRGEEGEREMRRRRHCYRYIHVRENTRGGILLPKAVCYCLQTCNFCFDENLSEYVCTSVYQVWW